MATGSPLVLVVMMVPGFRTASTLLKKGTLELKVLDDGLDDPVNFGEFREVVFEVADSDQAGEGGVHESGGP